jgi:hypothetical protein
VTDANTRPNATSAALLVDRLKAADNLRRSGDLPSVKIGTRRLFDMDDLRRFIEARKAVKP